jgi:hypothetical protein
MLYRIITVLLKNFSWKKRNVQKKEISDEKKKRYFPYQSTSAMEKFHQVVPPLFLLGAAKRRKILAQVY